MATEVGTKLHTGFHSNNQKGEQLCSYVKTTELFGRDSTRESEQRQADTKMLPAALTSDRAS